MQLQHEAEIVPEFGFLSVTVQKGETVEKTSSPIASIYNLFLVHYVSEIIKTKVRVICVLHNPGFVLNVPFRHLASAEVE